MCTADGGKNTLSRSRFRLHHNVRRSDSAVTKIARMTRDRIVEMHLTTFFFLIKKQKKERKKKTKTLCFKVFQAKMIAMS